MLSILQETYNLEITYYSPFVEVSRNVRYAEKYNNNI